MLHAHTYARSRQQNSSRAQNRPTVHPHIQVPQAILQHAKGRAVRATLPSLPPLLLSLGIRGAPWNLLILYHLRGLTMVPP